MYLFWTSFFAAKFKKLAGIKKLHHFRINSAQPGTVFVKERSDATSETVHHLLKHPWTPDPHELPNVVLPKGLPAERQWYLYEKIRPYCSYETKDVTCPLPIVPRPTSRRGTPASPPASPPDSPQPPAKKRRCGICRQEGHNSTVCPDKSE